MGRRMPTVHHRHMRTAGGDVQVSIKSYDEDSYLRLNLIHSCSMVSNSTAVDLTITEVDELIEHLIELKDELFEDVEGRMSDQVTAGPDNVDFDWRGRIKMEDWTEAFSADYGLRGQAESFTVQVGVTCSECGEPFDDEGVRTLRITGGGTLPTTVETWHPEHAPADLFGIPEDR